MRSSALVGDRVERVVGEDELDVVELEEALELLGERVARLGEDRDQVVARELVDDRHDRQPADELGDEPVLDEVPTRCSMTLSRFANAPPQMNRMFVVSMVRNSWFGCLRPRRRRRTAGTFTVSSRGFPTSPRRAIADREALKGDDAGARARDQRFR